MRSHLASNSTAETADKGGALALRGKGDLA